jgi:bifunctional non-homologous end joining protein LigD
VAGITLSHPDRVVFAEAGITKLDLALFYQEIADWLLPQLRDRPLTLVRCPDGAGTTCFYMKHLKSSASGELRQVSIREKTKIGAYLIADTLSAVVELVQMNVLEIHTWNARFARLERPDRVVFDIDPGPRVAWKEVIEAARLVRSVLRTLGLESFVKTTGARGLHVVAPIEPQEDWETVVEFSRDVADAIAREHPDRYTTTFAKAGREQKILIDYLRNSRGHTSVAAYSTRARPVGSVSAPLRWEELSSDLPSDHFTVRTLAQRLGALRKDPWAEYGRLRQRVTPAARKAIASFG